METTTLIFANPKFFVAFSILPVLAILFAWAWMRSSKLIGRIVAPRLREQLAGSVSGTMRVVRALLLLVVLGAAIVTLARPQKGFITHDNKQMGRDIIIAIDVSRSMLATDMLPTRLFRARLLARDIVEMVPGDRLGIVAFAGSAFLQTPLTLDRTALFAAIDELDTDIIPRGGTNIAEAIRMAQNAFGKGEGTTRALVIVSDGEELDADAVAAAQNSTDMRIFTVGIGSAEGSLIPIKDESGRNDFVRDEEGKQVHTRLDAARLEEIAAATGGFSLPLDTNTAQEIFTRGILPLEETARESFVARTPIEQYQWPLGVALACLVLWLLLGERRWRANRNPLAKT